MSKTANDGGHPPTSGDKGSPAAQSPRRRTDLAQDLLFDLFNGPSGDGAAAAIPPRGTPAQSPPPSEEVLTVPVPLPQAPSAPAYQAPDQAPDFDEPDLDEPDGHDWAGRAARVQQAWAQREAARQAEPERTATAAASRLPDIGTGPGAQFAPGREPAEHGAPAKRDGNDDWRDSVPYEETGILIRPADWSTDRIETALINVSALREAERDEKESLAGRPRFGLMRFVPTPRRGILLTVLLTQALLSLRGDNTAFEDEALYLYSGHLELDHLINGVPIDDFATYFSGAPVLYPVVGAIADQVGGVIAARLLSLAFMLGATCLVYLIGKRLFGVRSALCGAGLFGTTASAVFVGGLATYDAPAVFLLALAAWIVVRWAASSWPYYALAVLPMVLAVGTKYASLLFLPTIVVLSFISALPYHGRRWSLLRPAALIVVVASMAYGALKLAGPSYVQGIQFSTTSRAQGGTSTHTMLLEIGKWGGPVFIAALVGGVYYVFRHRPDVDSRLRLGTWGRVALAVLLLGTALLAPANQLRLHTDVSLQKHVGFGLLFAAPLAGYGLVRLVGGHFGRLQLGIGVGVLAFAFGMAQSHVMFRGWPDSTRLVAAIKQYQKPGAHYLVEVDEVPIYYLRSDTSAEPAQFTSTFYFLYQDGKGRSLTGPDAYRAAVDDGYFQIVAIEDGTTTPQIDQAILAGLRAKGGKYRLAAKIAEPTSASPITYQVWVKK